MSTEQITQALSEMRQLRETLPLTGHYVGGIINNGKIEHNFKVEEYLNASANSWITLISCLEKACATLKKECCCPGETSWTTGKDILCDPCETLTQIAEMLKGPG